MSVDLNNYKIPIFPNINDIPVQPTANKAGNGADLIARVNGLIEELSTLLNSGNDNSINWTLKASDKTNYSSFDIHYLNASERQLYKSITADTALTLLMDSFVANYTLGTNITPNEVVDISELINQRGIGYYFFLFKNADGTFKTNTYVYPNELSAVKGAVNLLEEGIYVQTVLPTYTTSDPVYAEPLVVRQVIKEMELIINT